MHNVLPRPRMCTVVFFLFLFCCLPVDVSCHLCVCVFFFAFVLRTLAENRAFGRQSTRVPQEGSKGDRSREKHDPCFFVPTFLGVVSCASIHATTLFASSFLDLMALVTLYGRIFSVLGAWVADKEER